MNAVPAPADVPAGAEAHPPAQPGTAPAAGTGISSLLPGQSLTIRASSRDTDVPRPAARTPASPRPCPADDSVLLRLPATNQHAIT